MKRSLFALSAAVCILLPSVGHGNVQAAHTRAGTNITIWEDFPDAALPAMKTLAGKWAASSGNSVTFVSTSQPNLGGQSVNGLLQLKAKSKGAADLAYTTEDSLGSLAAAGLIAQRPSSVLSTADQAAYQSAAIGAASVNGVPYAVPQVLDGLVLFYNKKLVPTPPSDWTQLIATAKKLTTGKQHGFLYNITGGLYYNFWAYSGFGAYVFGNKDGKIDTTDIGLAGSGAVQALTFLKSLTTVVPASTDYNAADSNFTAGNAAMTINGPWALAAYQKALGANLGLEPIPALPNGKAAHTFIGVRVWAVNAFSKNQTVAWDLAKYLSQNGQAISGTFEGRLPSLKSVPGFTPSPLQVQAIKAFSVGVPMPNIPEFTTVWTPEQNAITLVVQGRATPATALNSALQQIKAAIAKAHANN